MPLLDIIEDNPGDWERTLAEFHNLCKEQMLRNKHKGMRQAWTAQNLELQLICLQMSVAELRTALAFGIDISDKAADVSNWGFIIQDNFFNNPKLIGLPANTRFNG